MDENISCEWESILQIKVSSLLNLADHWIHNFFSHNDATGENKNMFGKLEKENGTILVDD